MKNTIKTIVENAGFNVEIIRHGIYTDYVITRNDAKYLIESIAHKGQNKYYRFSSVNEFRNLTKYTVFHYERESSFGTKHTLVDGNYHAKLTIDEIRMLIDNN